MMPEEDEDYKNMFGEQALKNIVISIFSFDVANPPVQLGLVGHCLALQCSPD